MRLAPFAMMKDEDFTRLMDVNLKGGFNVLREAAKRVRDGGRIISMSSSITQLRTATYGPYAASKAALEIFSSCLAKELRGRQISVNALAPGVVATSLFLDVPGRTETEVRQFAERTPHGRIGTPEDLAAVIAALVSSDASWVNGQTVFANGGLV
jgi:3-oxoacyl-[acyl-carrier protein] reductase